MGFTKGDRAMIKRLTLGALFFVSISLSLIQPAMADFTGTILGVVTDQTGATIPNVKVTLSNPGTGFRRLTTTNATGAYEFLAIPAGGKDAGGGQGGGFRKYILYASTRPV